MKSAVDTLPASWYCDPFIYQKERETIFRQEWLYAAHVSEFSEVGEYVSTEIAGYPIVLVRKEHGEIAAFHNVCRHRGAPLLTEPQGKLTGSTMTCRYHGWSYNTDGKLAAAPYFDCSSSCDREKFSLYSIRTEVFDGLVFVNLSPEGKSFHDEYGELVQCIQSASCNLSDYKFHSKMVREGNFNWKVWVDGYQECYHCPTIHPVFLKDFQLTRYLVENRSRFSLHSCERRIPSSSGAFEGLWLWIYPNLGMPIYEPAFYTLQVNPLNTNRTQLTYTFHFRETVEEQTIQEFRNFVEQITEEDINVCEAVQKNIEAGIFKGGVLNSARENGVIYFHSLVRKAITNTVGDIGARFADPSMQNDPVDAERALVTCSV